MKILGKFNFRIVLFTGIIEVLVTVLLCYTLAVTLQHKPAWLPTVSDCECGAEAPEKYLGSWWEGSCMLVVESVLLGAHAHMHAANAPNQLEFSDQVRHSYDIKRCQVSFSCLVTARL